MFRSITSSSTSTDDKLKPAKKKKITSLSEYFGSDPVKRKESSSKPSKVWVAMLIGDKMFHWQDSSKEQKKSFSRTNTVPDLPEHSKSLVVSINAVDAKRTDFRRAKGVPRPLEIVLCFFFSNYLLIITLHLWSAIL